jgi:hypothetical protein
MSRRGGGQGDLFGNSRPEDEALPELEEILHLRAPRKSRTRSRSTFAAASTYSFRGKRQRVGERHWLRGLRVGLSSLLLICGLFGLVAGLVQTASGYTDADIMASAPVCASGVDLTNTTENCVGDVTALSSFGAISDSGGDTTGLIVPGKVFAPFQWVGYPGDAQFDAALGDGPAQVRAEFWKGQIVTLTAGTPGVSVTTDLNPNNVGGSGLGVAFIALALVLLSILLLIGIRAIRLRWLRPGLALRLGVSGLSVWSLGLFVAGICLINQPARVALVLAIAPAITAGLTALLWLAFAKGRYSRVRRTY